MLNLSNNSFFKNKMYRVIIIIFHFQNAVKKGTTGQNYFKFEQNILEEKGNGTI